MDEIFKRGNDLLLQRKTKKEEDDVFKKVDNILKKSKSKTQNTPLKKPDLQPALTPFQSTIMEVSVFCLFRFMHLCIF